MGWDDDDGSVSIYSLLDDKGLTKQGADYQQQQHLRKDIVIFLNLGRAFLGGAVVVLYIYSLGNLSLSVAYLVIATNPLITAMLSPFFFEEDNWRVIDTIATLFCLGGIVLVSKPFSASSWDKHVSQEVEGMIEAIGAAFLMAINSLVIRVYRTQGGANAYNLYGMLGTAVLSAPGFIYEQVRGNGRAGKRKQFVIYVGAIASPSLRLGLGEP